MANKFLGLFVVFHKNVFTDSLPILFNLKFDFNQVIYQECTIMVVEVVGFVDRDSGCYLAGEDILITVCKKNF